MESLGQRIARLRTIAGLSQTALGARCGWESGQARISNYERDFREPNLSELRNIAAALSVSLYELLDGDEANSKIGEMQGAYLTAKPPADYAMIPQYSAHGAAGHGHTNDHVEVKGGLAFKRDWLRRMGLREGSLSVIYVHGHSMDPTICDADVLLIDENQRDPKDGRIFVILKPDGDVIIKRLIKSLTGGWIVRSDNDDKRTYPDQPITENDIEQLQIIGRAVWHGGSL